MRHGESSSATRNGDDATGKIFLLFSQFSKTSATSRYLRSYNSLYNLPYN
jgi:hypothetical protein